MFLELLLVYQLIVIVFQDDCILVLILFQISVHCMSITFFKVIFKSLACLLFVKYYYYLHLTTGGGGTG